MKVVMVYDACRAHLSLECLSILRDGGVEVYAIHPHTSGATQPLDLAVYSAFKKQINENLSRLTNAKGLLLLKLGKQSNCYRFLTCAMYFEKPTMPVLLVATYLVYPFFWILALLSRSIT